MTDEAGEPHAVKLGRVSWNDECARLVVLDGQHRAMALIAIERTLSGSWAQSTGNKYRHFYEHRIEALLEKAREDGNEIDLTGVEFPVTICWFPDHSSPGRNPHEVARKLFVDVNKNARQPSEARLVLLSDTELVNIFTRALLNQLRSKTSSFPIYAVEYDNPDKESSRPVRWSVFTNITMLRNMVEKAVFGPSKYIEDVDVSFGGRPNQFDMNVHMHRQLALEEIFPEEIDEIEGRTIKRESITGERFPQYNKDAQRQLVDRFMAKWGDAILHLLAEVLPYKQHINAVRELEKGWLTDDAIASLAKDAMFEGVGMYWTLRESHAYWHDQDKSRLPGEPLKDKPEIVKAWDVIEVKGNDFKTLRAKHFLGSTNTEQVTRSEELYNMVNTYACQLGMVMTLATIHNDNSKVSTFELAEVLAQAWNFALVGAVTKTLDRRCVFSKSERHSINMIPKLDTPHAIYFRYFFFELLGTPEAKGIWQGIINEDALRRRIKEARAPYFSFLVKEKEKAIKRTEPALKEAKRKEKAKELVKKDLSKSLEYWFKYSPEDFDSWLSSLKAKVEPENEDNEEIEGETTGDRDEMDELLEKLENL